MKKLAYSLSGILIVFIAWTILYLAVSNNYVVPSPLKSVKEALLLFGKGYFYSALFSSLLRVLISFLISIITAVITAVISYRYKTFASIFGSVIAVMRSLPTLAIMLIILVAINRSTAPIIVCILTLIPLLYTAIFTALSGVKKDLIEMCKVYKVPCKKQVFSLYIPSILPTLCFDFSSALSFSLKLVISAEILADVYKSFGGLMVEASIYSETVMLFALAIAICVIGIIIEFIGKFAFDKMEKKGYGN
ncbi:MAG: ABC transporter permease subunit [Clostridia bacterium]|nr:ABC transporter permease subunit [Clostridia bacterium]